MPKRSAGLLLFRNKDQGLEVFLVHPGGPFWRNKDLGAWSIPKGEIGPGEAACDAAKREFTEETGFAAPANCEPLGEVAQSGVKTVSAWFAEGDLDPAQLRSCTCSIEWPPRSGRTMEVPEVDRGAWFSIDEARDRLLKGQQPFLDRLQQMLADRDKPPHPR